MRRFLVLSAVVLAAFFADAWVGGRVLSQADVLFMYPPWSALRPAGFVFPGNALLGDVPMVFYPFLKETSASLGRGELPLWSPALYAGHPFLASYQSAVFSPFTLFGLMLAPADAILASAVAKLLAGALGMFLFLRRIGLHPAATLFGALACLLHPFTVVWLEHPPSAVAPFVPWLLWGAERLLASRAWRDVAVLALLVAGCLVAGHPETAYKALLLLGAYCAGGSLLSATGHGTGSRAKGARRLVARCLPAAVLGLLLAAVQVVPFLEYLGESGTAAMRRSFASNPIVAPAETVVTMVVPGFFGVPSRGATATIVNRNGIPTNYAEQQAYPGVATWVLAAFGTAALWRTWRVRFFAGVALVSALVMYGARGLIDVYSWVPVAGLAVPSRFGLLSITAVTILGAHGVHVLMQGERPHDRRARRAAAGVVAMMLVLIAATLLWTFPLLRGPAIVKETAAYIVWALALAAASLALVWPRPPRLAPAPTAAALTALVIVDLFAAGWRFHPMMPRERVFPTPPAIAEVQADSSLYRVAGLGPSLIPNTAMAYGLQDLRGYDGVTPRRYAELLESAFGSGQFHEIDAHEPMALLDLLNVKYVFAGPLDDLAPPQFTRIVDGAARVYRNERVFPRAFLVSRVRSVPAAEGLGLMAKGAVDLRREAVLSEPLDADEQPEPSDPDRTGDARVARYASTEVVIETDAPGRRLLVLSDHFYPGWAAYVDGRAVPIRRAYHALRAVAVPAGRHSVRFVYEARIVWTGAALSGVALVVTIGLLLIPARAGRTE